jgi:cytochrome c peroxidase
MFVLLFASCSKDSPKPAPAPNLPATPYAYSTNAKDKIDVIGFTLGVVTVNPTAVTPSSSVSITLGRVIFNDHIITVKNAIACSGCHVAAPRVQSTAILTSDNANTQSTANVIREQAVDGRYRVHPEVGMENINTLIAKMSATSYYPQLFRQAYGTSEINAERIADALAQYASAQAAVSPEELTADPRFANPFK